MLASHDVVILQITDHRTHRSSTSQTKFSYQKSVGSHCIRHLKGYVSWQRMTRFSANSRENKHSQKGVISYIYAERLYKMCWSLKESIVPNSSLSSYKWSCWGPTKKNKKTKLTKWFRTYDGCILITVNGLSYLKLLALAKALPFQLSSLAVLKSTSLDLCEAVFPPSPPV